MEKNNGKYNNLLYLFILIFIISYIYVALIINTQGNQSEIINQLSIIFGVLIAAVILSLIVIAFYYLFVYAMHLIDMFILAIPYPKITNQTFYCQVCKVVVDVDDSFCTNCGQEL